MTAYLVAVKVEDEVEIFAFPEEENAKDFAVEMTDEGLEAIVSEEIELEE
jgi:hypothetical protein